MPFSHQLLASVHICSSGSTHKKTKMESSQTPFIPLTDTDTLPSGPDTHTQTQNHHHAQTARQYAPQPPPPRAPAPPAPPATHKKSHHKPSSRAQNKKAALTRNSKRKRPVQNREALNALPIGLQRVVLELDNEDQNLDESFSLTRLRNMSLDVYEQVESNTVYAPTAPIIGEKKKQKNTGEEVDCLPDDHRRHSVQLKLHSEVADDAKFRTGVFIKQFLYHMFLPISLPFWVCIEGKKMCWNQRVLLKRSRQGWVFDILLQYVATMLFWALLILYNTHKSELANVSSSEIGVACLSLVAHRLVVATKYAVMPEKDYQHLHEQILPVSELVTYQLVDGWGAPSRKVVLSELRGAGERLGTPLRGLYFRSSSARVHGAHVKGPDSDGEEATTYKSLCALKLGTDLVIQIVQVREGTHTRTYTHTHAHTYSHTHAHTYSHTHTPVLHTTVCDQAQHTRLAFPLAFCTSFGLNTVAWLQIRIYTHH